MPTISAGTDGDRGDDLHALDIRDLVAMPDGIGEKPSLLRIARSPANWSSSAR